MKHDPKFIELCGLLKSEPELKWCDLIGRLSYSEAGLKQAVKPYGGLKAVRRLVSETPELVKFEPIAKQCRYYVASKRGECGVSLESGQYCPEHYARVNYPNGGCESRYSAGSLRKGGL